MRYFDCATNKTTLVFESGKGQYTSRKEAAKVCERFLQTAELLPKKSFLGWQIDAGKTDRSYVFSDLHAPLEKEDFNWIFSSCAVVADNRLNDMRELFQETRRVYMLTNSEHIIKKTRPKMGKGDFLYIDDGCDEESSSEYLREIVDMLLGANAIVQIAVGQSDKDHKNRGVVLISLPREMTLRMRTAISLAFPHIETTELQKDSAYDCIPDACLSDVMFHLLFALICKNAESEDEQSKLPEKHEPEPDSSDKSIDEDISEPFTPIDNLDLSVRSYNCLKRAGVTSVEHLKKMTDDDFIHIRNLSRKCVEEIKWALEKNQITPLPITFSEARYMDKLNELIGLDGVKEQIRKIAAFAKMKQDLEARGIEPSYVSLNMSFIGNPGTAKTTVARITAGILHEIGILPCPDIVEVGRADLVAKYEGQTASKVKEIFQKAKGKILFIDEAYSLVERQEGEFGDEAINTIVQEMENNRKNTIVILAGYPNKMKKFFARNPGLRSRVPFCIEFKNYSAEEMLQIVDHEAHIRGFSVDKKAKDKVKSICESATGIPDAGNGRFCRNLTERAILNYAFRVYGRDNAGDDTDFILLDEDFPDSILKTEDQKPNQIGFKS